MGHLNKNKFESVDCGSGFIFLIKEYFKSCVCEEGWTGVDCGVRECSINCGQHGACENMECVCEKGILELLFFSTF